VRVAQEFLGHASIVTTEVSYQCHVSCDELREMVNDMLRALGYVSFCRLALPDDLIYEPRRAEYLIQDGFGVKANVPIKIDVNSPGFVE
jgi:hypothetical protein